MPKKPIDYSKTIMYHFVCEDSSITNEYVGHTTDWSSRKRSHKSDCKGRRKDCYKYKIINENGGWENWRMVPLEEFPCENEIQARIREEYWRKELKADMNSQRAYRSPEEKKEYKKQNNKLHKDKQNKARVEKYKTDTIHRSKRLNLEKVRYENNKERIKQRQGEYYSNNKDFINDVRRWKRAMKEQESTFYLSCVQKILF